MAKVTFEYDAQEIRTNIRNLDRRMESAIDATMDYEAAWATGQLKMRAPWTDRTGAARTGLLAVANKLGPGAHEIIMAYSVHYGIWLEIANSGKYAVIGPFMPILGRQVMHDLEHLIDRLGKAQ
jgi:hypothetical protein